MARQYQNSFENYLTVQRVAEKTKKAYLQSVQGLELFHKQSANNGEIVFTYKNREDNHTEKMILTAEEFIRHFLLHVLPYRFMKIRYYGFVANKIRRKSILLIRRLIGIAMEIEFFIKESLQEKILRITGKDIYLCPECKQGRMICQSILLSDRG